MKEKDILIIGAGGFAREVLFLLENNNKKVKEWNILGFVDNERTDNLHGYPIWGTDERLLGFNRAIFVVCAVGNPNLKKKIIERLRPNHNIIFPNIISIDSQGDWNNIIMPEGCIICGGSILTTDIVLGGFVTVNLGCTIGHDTRIGNYSTISPGSNISGNVIIEECVDIGTGCQIIPKGYVEKHAVLGAGTVVISRIPAESTAVGVPARVIK